MTHSSPAAALRRAPQRASLNSPSLPALLGDRSRLRQALADRHAAIAAIEVTWVAASEADAAQHASRDVRMDDRSTWDHATWDRYLVAASKHEPDYKPRIMRLLREAESLERLLAMLDPARHAGSGQSGERTMRNQRPGDGVSALPPLCYIRHPTTGQTVEIRRGEEGFYPMGTKCSPECLNAKLAHPPMREQVQAMQHGSLLGWDTPGADPAMWVRSAAPEAS